VDGEFPSQSLAWARQVQLRGATLDIVAKPADGDWTAALLARIRQPGLPPIAVAALTPLHWTDGTLIDIARLVPSLRDQGAAIVVDATQAAGILPLDVATLGADYLVFPTYKWVLGPYTLAFLYAAPHRQNGTPLERHGANHVGGAAPFTGSLGSPIPTARRYDMGERLNPVSLPMALAGMTLLRQWGRDPVAARLRHLTNLLATEAESCGWTPVPRALRPPHILGLRPPAGVSTDAALASLAKQGVYVAERGGVMRLGAHVYNDDADVARFATALRQIRPD
jgi:selenocysteine lyase/cysteine desulfurase